MGVSKNSGTPKSSILIGFSITNHPFWGTPIFGNIHIWVLILHQNHVQLMRNLTPKKHWGKIEHLSSSSASSSERFTPPKKGSKTSKRQKTQYFHPLLFSNAQKKQHIKFFVTFFCDDENGDPFKGWNCENPQRFGDKVRKSLHLDFPSLLNGGSGFLWDESGGYTYLFTIKIQI